MKIIKEPKVYLHGVQSVVDAELQRFLDDHGVTWESDSENAAEVLAETAGRICYMSFSKPRPGGNKAYLHHILESGHGSVLESAVWNLIVTGISRSCSHELIRHRAGVGVSMLSQRYVDESVAAYIEPDIIANDPDLHAIWLDAVSYSHYAYKQLADKLNAKLLSEESERIRQEHAGNWCGTFAFTDTTRSKTESRKTARQAARSVLPNATETKIALTLNARAARNIIEQRGSRHAEPEIRKLANAILDVLVKDSPNLFSDYQRTQLPDRTFEITTKYPKV